MTMNAVEMVASLRNEMKQQLICLFLQDPNYSYSTCSPLIKFFSREEIRQITMESLDVAFDACYIGCIRESLDTSSVFRKTIADFLPWLQKFKEIAIVYSSLCQQTTRIYSGKGYVFVWIMNIMIAKIEPVVLETISHRWKELLKKEYPITPSESEIVKAVHGFFYGHLYSPSRFKSEIGWPEIREHNVWYPLKFKLQETMFRDSFYSKYETPIPSFICILVEYKRNRGTRGETIDGSACLVPIYEMFSGMMIRCVYDNPNFGLLHAVIRHNWDRTLGFGNWENLTPYCQGMIDEIEAEKDKEPNYGEFDEYMKLPSSTPDRIVLKQMQRDLISWMQIHFTAETLIVGKSSGEEYYFRIQKLEYKLIVKPSPSPCDDDHLGLITLIPSFDNSSKNINDEEEEEEDDYDDDERKAALTAQCLLGTSATIELESNVQITAL